MSKIRIEHILIGLLSILIINSFINVFKGTGMSEEEHLWRVKYNELEKINESLLIENEIIQKDYERIEKNMSSDSSAVWNGSRVYRDSLRAILNPS